MSLLINRKPCAPFRAKNVHRLSSTHCYQCICNIRKAGHRLCHSNRDQGQYTAVDEHFNDIFGTFSSGLTPALREDLRAKNFGQASSDHLSEKSPTSPNI